MRDNFVELIWNNSIKNCQNMFRRYYDITELIFLNQMLHLLLICLSYFDTLQAIKMDDMYFYSTLLNSLNISNLVLSNIEQINNIFKEYNNF